MSERTREPERAVPERERRASAGTGQAAGRKRPSQGQRFVERGETVRRPDTAPEKRRSSQGQSTGGTEKKRPAASGQRTGAEENIRRAGTSERDRRAGTSERGRKPEMSERERRPETSEKDRRPGTSERDRRSDTSERDRRSGTSERDRRSGTSERDRRPETSERGRRTGMSENARKSGAAERNKRTKTASGRNGRPSDRSGMDDDGRMTSRELERARRREERLRRVRRQKIIMAASATVIVLCLLTILIFFLSPAKCILSLSRGDRYARDEEYDKALEAYQEAIEINEKSVRAYRGAAGCLRMKEQTLEAEQILYTGWEKTKDEGILRYYNKLLINDAVADINAGNCTQTTVDKLNRVLMNDPENLDAIALMDTCKQRMAREE